MKKNVWIFMITSTVPLSLWNKHCINPHGYGMFTPKKTPRQMFESKTKKQLGNDNDARKGDTLEK